MTGDKTTKTFIVLGMHRSATSLVAGALHNFGVNMGKELMSFEDIDFFRLNEEILKEAGGSWQNPPPEKKILALAKKFAPKIKKLVENKSGLWDFKDPRTILTIKLYLPYLKNPHFICCFGEPLEIARSLYKRQKMPIKKGLKLAEIYNKRLLNFLNEIHNTKK